MTFTPDGAYIIPAALSMCSGTDSAKCPDGAKAVLLGFAPLGFADGNKVRPVCARCGRKSIEILNGYFIVRLAHFASDVERELYKGIAQSDWVMWGHFMAGMDILQNFPGFSVESLRKGLKC